MGNIKEENIFMEAEGDEPDAPKDEKAPAKKEKAAEKEPDLTKEEPQDKEDAPEDAAGEDPFAGGGTEGDAGGDPFAGGGEVEGDSDEVLEGLPKDEQYYVIILKNASEKIQKLKEVSLRLLNKNDEKDSKLIEKISSLEYVFDRFVEQYEEYENPKAIIIRLQKATNALLMFTNAYLKRGKK